MTSASIVTEVRSCRLDAPIVRSVANSRIRCDTVIESVLKMTNAPTKSAIVANESRKYLMIFVNEADFFASFTCCARVRTSTLFSGTTCLICETS